MIRSKLGGALLVAILPTAALAQSARLSGKDLAACTGTSLATYGDWLALARGDCFTGATASNGLAETVSFSADVVSATYMYSSVPLNGFYFPWDPPGYAPPAFTPPPFTPPSDPPATNSGSVNPPAPPAPQGLTGSSAPCVLAIQARPWDPPVCVSQNGVPSGTGSQGNGSQSNGTQNSGPQGNGTQSTPPGNNAVNQGCSGWRAPWDPPGAPCTPPEPPTDNNIPPGGDEPPVEDDLNNLVNEPNATPEPATLLLVASGLGGVGALSRLRRKAGRKDCE